MDALKASHRNYPAGENWNHSENSVVIFKNIRMGEKKIHKAVEAHLFNDLFQSPMRMSLVNMQKYPEWYFNPYISLKVYFLSSRHCNLSDDLVTKCLKITSGGQVKVVKLFSFFCFFSKVEPLWNPSSSNSNKLYLLWNSRGVKSCWQEELLLRLPVLCQIALEEERGFATNDIHAHNHMSICAHTCTFQNTTVCTDSLQRISFRNFLWVISEPPAVAGKGVCDQTEMQNCKTIYSSNFCLLENILLQRYTEFFLKRVNTV